MKRPRTDGDREALERPRERDPQTKRAPERERGERTPEPGKDVEREAPRPGGPGDARP